MQASRVQPGTALEQLILDNQQFELLRPDEVGDKLPYPPWLRVYWRKSHPERSYSAQDPTGGYPRVLRNLHSWMTTHQDLVPGPVAPRARAVASTETPDSLSVGGNVRVSGAQTATRSESDIRINYWDGTKLVAASNNIGGNDFQAQYHSSDSGVTWGQTTLAAVGTDTFHSDPSVDWTSDGTAWSTTLGINSRGTVIKGRAYKSFNGGATWTFDGTFSGTQSDIDKSILWVDHSATSPHANNLYVIWNRGPAYVNRRSAGSWQTPIQVSGFETTGTALGGDIKTNASGDVFALWPDTGSSKLYVAKSTDGGATYGVPNPVTSTFASFDIGVPAMNDRRVLIYVSGTAYRTATRDEVYASWVDLTGAGTCTAGHEPGADVTSPCKTRVWFARSTDGGANWSTPSMINDQMSLNDQFNQWLTLDETTGALGIIYYDTIANSGRLKTDVWYQRSTDGGATWTWALKITTAQTDETVTGADFGNQYGDYNSLSANGGILFPSWTDRRNGAREEIWTVKLDETPVPGTLPDAPTIGIATAGNASITVDFTPGALGTGALLTYTANCGGVTAIGAAPPITVTGLIIGSVYTCVVRATTTVGTSVSSSPSNLATPFVTPPALTGVFARKVHGAAGTFNLPLSGVVTNPTTEPRQGSSHTIVFTFDKPVTSGVATLTEGTATVGLPTFSGNEMRVPLTGVSNRQYVTVAVANVNSVDGGTGGSGSIRIGFLLGDVTQNRVVTLSDLGQVNAQIAQVVTSANYLKDVNANGTLSLADKGIVNGQITKALPAP